MAIDFSSTRYKIIAGWPRGGFPVGLVFTGTTLNDLNKSVIECDKYPHLFKKLEWWEEREVSFFETIEFVKVNYWLGVSEGYEGISENEVRKVKGFGGCGIVVEFENGYSGHSKFWQPSTKEEYDQYINSKL